MKRFLMVLFVMAIVFTGCTNTGNGDTNSKDAVYIKISPKDAKALMDSEDVIVLDVRTIEEFNSGHIESAVLLPVDNIAKKAEEVLTDKNAKILVYCRSGNRSATAANALIKMGYTNVLDFGGINSWPYEIVQ